MNITVSLSLLVLAAGSGTEPPRTPINLRSRHHGVNLDLVFPDQLAIIPPAELNFEDEVIEILQITPANTPADPDVVVGVLLSPTLGQEALVQLANIEDLDLITSSCSLSPFTTPQNQLPNSGNLFGFSPPDLNFIKRSADSIFFSPDSPSKRQRLYADQDSPDISDSD